MRKIQHGSRCDYLPAGFFLGLEGPFVGAGDLTDREAAFLTVLQKFRSGVAGVGNLRETAPGRLIKLRVARDETSAEGGHDVFRDHLAASVQCHEVHAAGTDRFEERRDAGDLNGLRAFAQEAKE